MRAIQANATGTNRASCTVAMKARARGLDALPKKVRLEDIGADLDLSVASWEPESCFKDAKMMECDKETHEEAQKRFSDATSSFGDGGRGILLLEWLSGKRHAASLLHRDGETFVLDSQNQEVSSAEYLRRCIPNSIRVSCLPPVGQMSRNPCTAMPPSTPLPRVLWAGRWASHSRKSSRSSP